MVLTQEKGWCRGPPVASDLLGGKACSEWYSSQTVACFNPLLAQGRRRKRGELFAATEAALTKIQREARRRTKTRLRAEEIGQKVGRVITRHKMGKHFDRTIAARL